MAEEKEPRIFFEKFATAKDYFDDFLSRCLKAKISDIHIENLGEACVIRVRQEGSMREWARLPVDRISLLIRRIKFISGLDPERSGYLQEGRFEYESGGQKVVMRLSIIPTPGSDDIVIRILGSSPEVFGLKQLGFDPVIEDGLKICVNRATGLVLVTGPTGSGKTSTLYAAIQEVNDGTNKIITVEDPIEYRVPGLSQVKMEEKGVSYANVLKGVLRHDPDIILIGEIRDLEAAEIAVEASMTGHLVLSTLHTNSAAATILRLINLGVQPIDVSNSLTAVYAQRLIRRLCQECKKEAPLKPELLKLIGDNKPPKRGFEAAGCEACSNLGIKGRVPVGELLMINDDIRDAIVSEPNLARLNKAAKDAGMRSIMQYCLTLVEKGEISLADVISYVS